MKKDRILTILQQTNSILRTGHFVYTTGLHGSVYINKDALYPHTKEVSFVGKLFAQRFKHKSIDVVAGPALGGIILSQWTAYHLSRLKKKEVLGIYTEKTKDNDHIFRRGYDALIKGRNILVVEDLTTTGSSVKKVIKSIKNAGGYVVAVGVMVNRDPERVNAKSIGHPFYALGVFKADSYTPDTCPLCKKNIPINTTVGHDETYLKGV